MKATINFALFGLYTMATNALAVDYDLDLEPCINGGVSSSGLYSSQDAEDLHASMPLAQSEK